jgi:Tfp pilus assembly protein PilO
MRLILPVILLVAAIGLFVVFTDPEYQKVQSLQTENASYTDALNKSQELKATRDQLLSKYDTFSADDLQKLSYVLPDNVDNIRLIIDINNIAARHGLTLSNVSVGNVTAGDSQSSLAVGQSTGAVGSVDVSFSVDASYSDFLAFLNDLEHSMRIVDVQKLSFTTGAAGLTDYSLDIRTYWLH